MFDIENEEITFQETLICWVRIKRYLEKLFETDF